MRASNGYPGKYGKEFMIDGLISKSWKNIYVSSSKRYPWVELELSNPEMISRIEIVNRHDCCDERLKEFAIRSEMNPLPISVGNGWLTNNEEVASFKGPSSSKKPENISFEKPVKAKYLTIQIANDFLQINEVRVFGAPPVPA